MWSSVPDKSDFRRFSLNELRPCYVCFATQETSVAAPVTLAVDKNGFYLHWTDQNQETELLDLTTIRDTRTGRYARVPKVFWTHPSIHAFWPIAAGLTSIAKGLLLYKAPFEPPPPPLANIKFPYLFLMRCLASFIKHINDPHLMEMFLFSRAQSVCM